MDTTNFKYVDATSRLHSYNEKEYYPDHALKYMEDLEKKWFIKTDDTPSCNTYIKDLIWITDCYKKFDYYKVTFDWSEWNLVTYELQYMKTHKQDDKEFIVLKDHKYYNIVNGNKTFIYKGNLINRTHVLINFNKEWAYYLDKDLEVGEQFDLWEFLDSFKKWGEHKLGRLAVPKLLY